MKNNVGYQQKEFIKAGYMVIQQTGKFVKACERWKKLSVGYCDTQALFQAYFMGTYDIFDAQPYTILVWQTMQRYRKHWIEHKQK